MLACVQVDTKDILFICGGAFIDLDRQVAERTAQSSMGFGNPVRCVGGLLSCHKLQMPFLEPAFSDAEITGSSFGVYA